jgi:hypothetical protein
MATTSVRVPGFLPSVWGLRFPNAFPRTPVLRIPGTTMGVGNAADGLCGGMTFMARDLFERRIAPPPDTTPPPDGPLFRYLVRRAFASFSLPAGPAKYELWMALPDHGSWFGMRGVVERTLIDEWPSIRAELDRGITSPLGLVRTRSFNPMDLGLNHQVLAYGYELSTDSRGAATGLDVQVYDPNWPGRDDVAIRVALRPVAGDATVSYVEGDRPVRGFFRTAYRPADPSAVVPRAPSEPSGDAGPPAPSGSSPVATGRDGSEIQSDQDPA